MSKPQLEQWLSADLVPLSKVRGNLWRRNLDVEILAFLEYFHDLQHPGAEHLGKHQRSCVTVTCESLFIAWGRKAWCRWAGQAAKKFSCCPVGSTLHTALPCRELVLSIRGDLDQLLSPCLFTTNNPTYPPIPPGALQAPLTSSRSFFLISLPQPEWGFTFSPLNSCNTSCI